MSIVGPDYDELKKYNLAEIYSPTPVPVAKEAPEPVSHQENSMAQPEITATTTAEMPSTGAVLKPRQCMWGES